MTKLVVEELIAGYPLSQTDTITSEKRTRLNAIRLFLLGFNTPVGDLLLELKKDSQTITSVQQSIADIKAQVDAKLEVSEAYWYGYINFQLPGTISLENGTIWSMELSGVNGYTFNESDYIGWIKPHEDFQNTRVGVWRSIDTLPFGYQLWKYKS